MNVIHQSGRDEPRRDDTTIHDVSFIDTSTYSLDLPTVAVRFKDAGLERTLRTLQRYCEQGHFRAAKYPTANGSVWLADPDSVDTKIKEILDVQAVADGHATTRPDRSSATDGDEQRMSRSVAEGKAPIFNVNSEATSERLTPNSDDSKYMSVPVGLVDALTDQLVEKDRQIKRRDEQIKDLVDAKADDRKLLAGALAIIHREDFLFGLPESEDVKPASDPTPAEQIQPITQHEPGKGDNPQHYRNEYGV